VTKTSTTAKAVGSTEDSVSFGLTSSQLSLYNALELITLGGGRAVEFELESLNADSTPSISELIATATAAAAAASGDEKEKEAADKFKSLRLPRTSGLTSFSPSAPELEFGIRRGTGRQRNLLEH